MHPGALESNADKGFGHLLALKGKSCILFPKSFEKYFEFMK